MSTAGDGLRLAVGTLSAVRVPPPRRVDPSVARWAVLLAPVAVLPLGVLAGVVVWLTGRIDLPPLATALLVVGVLAAGTRALHADGLSDVADGLTASYDRERSLAVMKSGASGPAGTVALLVVLGLQVAGIDGLLQPGSGAYEQLVDSSSSVLTAIGPSAPTDAPVLVAVAVCLSRWALLATCVAGVPAARSEGLGTPFAGCVPRATALAGAVVLVVLVGASGVLTGTGLVRAVLTAGAMIVVLAVLVHRAVRRFGGTTGDVHGAGIELALAVLLVGLASGTVTLGLAG